MKKAGQSPAVFKRITVMSARGNGPWFWRFGRFHRLGPAALPARPWQGDLRFRACGDCRFQPATFFFHAQFPSDSIASLQTLSPCNMARFWPKLLDIKKAEAWVFAKYGRPAAFKRRAFPQLFKVLETIGGVC